MQSKLEKDIQKEILDYAKNHPKIAWIDRANSGKVKVKGGFMQLHENGTPDLIGYSVYGQFIGIEIKTPESFCKKNQSLNDEQVYRIGHMNIHECIIGVACCVEHVDNIMHGVD